MLDKDWQIWHFNTSQSWEEVRGELSFIDISEIYNINSRIFKRIFLMKINLKDYLNGHIYNKVDSFFKDFMGAIEAIRIELIAKEAYLKELNEAKLDELVSNHKEFFLTVDSIVDDLEKGLNNKAFVESCELLDLFVEHVSRFDMSTFSIKKIIPKIDPFKIEEFNKFISYNEIPNIYSLQKSVISELVEFNISLARYSNDIFTIEESFEVLQKKLKILLKAEDSFLDKFYIDNEQRNYRKSQTLLKKVFQDVYDQIQRRDLPGIDEFVNSNVIALISHINKASYQKINLEKIRVRYLSYIDTFDEVSEIYNYCPDKIEIGKFYGEVLDIFKSKVEQKSLIINDIKNQINLLLETNNKYLFDQYVLMIFLEELSEIQRLLDAQERITSRKGVLLYKLTHLFIKGQNAKLKNTL